MARHFDHIDDCLDDLIARTGPHLTLGIPLGIGKPNPWVNALYRRVRNDPLLSLRIFTALSLEKPTAHSDMDTGPGGANGWYFYLNFTAVPAGYSD